MTGSATFEFFRNFLKAQSGLDLPSDKHYLLESRLMPIIRAHGLGSMVQLAAKLQQPGQDRLGDEVVDAMTTNESLFFRDKSPFEAFSGVMLPQLLAARPASHTIRIWCAAASNGQEPYSLAMLLRDNAAKLAGRKVEIVATDLSSEVLEKARSGMYTQFEVQRGLSVQYLLRYFSQTGELWQIAPEIRAMVEFRKLNLLHPFGGLGCFDVVFCRNVLIYFDVATKIDVLERVARVMALDGFLVLGGAESVAGLTNAFAPLADQRSVFVKSTRPSTVSVPSRSMSLRS